MIIHPLSFSLSLTHTHTHSPPLPPPQQSIPKLKVVDPLDYEGELNSRRKDLEREQFLNLLLFPQQDITVRQTSMDTCIY